MQVQVGLGEMMNWELIEIMLEIIEKAISVIEDEIGQEQDCEFTEELWNLIQAWGRLITIVEDQKGGVKR